MLEEEDGAAMAVEVDASSAVGTKSGSSIRDWL